MSVFKFEVRESAIHGKGLFARQDIVKGETIGRIKYLPAEEDGPYILWIGDQAVRVECDLKYINHSNKPNACYCDDLDVIAIRRIRRGEEITHDYGDDWR